MNKKYQKIWTLAQPYLRKGVKKDFVIHTQGVIRAINLILKKEKGEADLLLPAAILHDVGWSRVPVKLQESDKEIDKIKALKLHIKYSFSIVRKILKKLDYQDNAINKIIAIISAHKFKKPKQLNKRIFIDADNLSDAFKQQFESDAKQYHMTNYELYKFRIKNNYFYTKTAKDIFYKEVNKRVKNK